MMYENQIADLGGRSRNREKQRKWEQVKQWTETEAKSLELLKQMKAGRGISIGKRGPTVGFIFTLVLVIGVRASKNSFIHPLFIS